MIPLYAFLAVVAGAAIALQGVLNTQLREQFTLSLAVLWNATFFLVLAVLLWLLSGLPWITRERLAQTPTHLWLGGACGFAVVVIGALVFARLSATWTLSRRFAPGGRGSGTPPIQRGCGAAARAAPCVRARTRAAGQTCRFA